MKLLLLPKQSYITQVHYNTLLIFKDPVDDSILKQQLVIDLVCITMHL